MSQIKKKQHYVWKKYLTSWSLNDQIFTYLKSSNKTIKTSLEGVAQERFFYALEEFTEEEEIILKELINLWANDVVKPFVFEIFKQITSYSKLKRILESKILDDLNVSDVDKRLALLKANTMEDIHSTFEKLGEKLIRIRKIEDLEFLDNDYELLSTMIFISFQYLRTKSMQEIIKPVISRYPYLSEKYLNFLPFIYAPSIANSLTYVKGIKFVFFDNYTDIDFITTDQPIINVKKDVINSAGEVSQMDLYYPITPKKAIIIHYQEQKKKRKYILITKEEVIYYNNLMVKNAREFMFSSNIEQLRSFSNTL